MRTVVTFVEFNTPPETENQVITRMDNSGILCFTVLNSVHMIYCQFLFHNLDTKIGTCQKMFDFVGPDDSPPFDQRGKTNLCVQDAQWTNNDAFLVVLFKANSFGVIPRLGSQFVEIYNPTIVNIP